jgi:hypothetical protein
MRHAPIPKEIINHMKDKKDISNTRAIISYLAAIELRIAE